MSIRNADQFCVRLRHMLPEGQFPTQAIAGTTAELEMSPLGFR